MYKITGKTYEYKTELKDAGFTWNAATKTWDRAEPATEENGWRVLRGLQCGDLRYTNQTPNSADHDLSANARTRAALAFEGGY